MIFVGIPYGKFVNVGSTFNSDSYKLVLELDAKILWDVVSSVY